jgi:AcrR family transcriptional regulator
MRDRRRALGAQTRERILVIAERLFAANSYDGVGMREITREAGANAAAVHYHFGTKEALLVELLRARALPIAQKRIELLDAARRNGPLDLEAVLRAFLEPAFYENPGGELRQSPFAKLRARLSLENEPKVRKILSDIFDESSRMFLAALVECLPHLPQQEVYLRFHFLLGTMFYTMSNTGRVHELSGGRCDTSDPKLMLDRLVPFLAAGFRSPVPG